MSAGGRDYGEGPLYIWRDQVGCEFQYEELPSAMRHNVEASRKQGHGPVVLVRVATGEEVRKLTASTFEPWRLGSLVPEYGPMFYESPKRRGRKRRGSAGGNGVVRGEGGGNQDSAPLDRQGELGREKSGRPRGRPPKDPDMAAYKGQFKPIVFDIDNVLLVLYNFTQLKARQLGYEYVGSFSEWLREVVVRYFAEHSQELGLSHLFTEQELVILGSGMVAQEFAGGDYLGGGGGDSDDDNDDDNDDDADDDNDAENVGDALLEAGDRGR